MQLIFSDCDAKLATRRRQIGVLNLRSEVAVAALLSPLPPSWRVQEARERLAAASAAAREIECNFTVKYHCNYVANCICEINNNARTVAGRTHVRRWRRLPGGRVDVRRPPTDRKLPEIVVVCFTPKRLTPNAEL